MTWLNILVIIFIIALLVYGYLILNTFYKKRIEEDKETERKNKELAAEHNNLTAKIAGKEAEIKALLTRKEELNKDISRISAESKAKAQETYDLAYSAMQERLNNSAEEASRKYRLAEQEAKNEYLSVLTDCEIEFTAQIEEKKAEIEELRNQLAQLRDKTNAAIEADKRRMLNEQEKDYYKIIIPEEELHDIELLRNVVKELKKDPAPVNKVIWESYYKQPTMRLLGRLTPIGSPHIGIYKITNINTGECYIGQSADLRTRLRDHIKAGLGIDSTTNKFYTEMKKVGPQNFTYEIIEECDRALLNERERYWIEYYQSLDFGYNTVRGVKNDNKKNN